MLNKEMLLGTRKRIPLFTLVNKTNTRLEVREMRGAHGGAGALKTIPTTCTIEPGDTVVFQMLDLDDLIKAQFDSPEFMFLVYFREPIMRVEATGENCTTQSGPGLVVIFKDSNVSSMRATINYIEFDD